MDPFDGHPSETVEPDDHDDAKKSSRCLVESSHDEMGSNRRIDCDPTNLQKAHQQSRDEVSTRRSKSRGSNHVKIAAGLHAKHCRHVVVEPKTEQPCHQQSPQGNTDTCVAKGRSRQPEVKANKKKNAKVAGEGVLVPG